MSAIVHPHVGRYLFAQRFFEITGILFLWFFAFLFFLFLQRIAPESTVVTLAAFGSFIAIPANYVFWWLAADVSKTYEPDQREVRILTEVSKHLRIPDPRLCIIPESTKLFVFPGPFFRCVFLGEHLRSILTDEELSAASSHEVAHIRRGDALWSPLLVGGIAAYLINLFALYFAIFPDPFPLSMDQFWESVRGLQSDTGEMLSQVPIISVFGSVLPCISLSAEFENLKLISRALGSPGESRVTSFLY